LVPVAAYAGAGGNEVGFFLVLRARSVVGPETLRAPLTGVFLHQCPMCQSGRMLIVEHLWSANIESRTDGRKGVLVVQTAKDRLGADHVGLFAAMGRLGLEIGTVGMLFGRMSTSKMGVSTTTAAVITVRSAIQGIPSGRFRPSDFGIHTRRTASARYVFLWSLSASSPSHRSSPYFSMSAKSWLSTP
jgi:hypothetical protein